VNFYNSVCLESFHIEVKTSGAGFYMNEKGKMFSTPKQVYWTVGRVEYLKSSIPADEARWNKFVQRWLPKSAEIVETEKRFSEYVRSGAIKWLILREWRLFILGVVN